MNIQDIEPFLKALEKRVNDEHGQCMVNAFRVPTGHLVVEIATVGRYDRYFVDLNLAKWWVMYG